MNKSQTHDNLGAQSWLSWLVFAVGLAVWIAAQGSFASSIIGNRSLPPEPDDTLTYIVKTMQMEQCPRQDCPALRDLLKQLSGTATSPEEAKQKGLAASRVFPIYHPLYSLILLGLKKFGLTLMETHKLLWILGPIFFGLAFAYLLKVMWGLAAAGVALTLLAFTVFPDTGLHLVVPSNLAMAMGAVMWARIISRRGDAPWALAIGAVLLVTMHPIGRLYTVIGIILTLLVSECRLKSRVWVSLLVAGIVVGFAFISNRLINIPGLVGVGVDFPASASQSFLVAQIRGVGATLVQFFSQIVVLEGGLFGSLPLFIGAATIGFAAVPPEQRKVNLKATLLYAFFVVIALLTVSSHPADIVFRMWIPLVVMLVGAVGYAICYSLRQSIRLVRDYRSSETKPTKITPERCWPLVVFAVLLGLACNKVLWGSEQMIAMQEHMIVREPLKICPSQPEMLLSQAKPGDRVLYTSIISMPYYFIQGAMQLGAVYYNPALKGKPVEEELLGRKDLRYAVLYSPMMYHPSFEGVNEDNWWITMPPFRFSPLNKPKVHQPLSREGVIYASDFKWVDVKPALEFPRTVKIFVANKRKASQLVVTPIRRQSALAPSEDIVRPIPADWQGTLELELPSVSDLEGFRLSFPASTADYAIEGIAFGDDSHKWPWEQKTVFTFMPSQPGSDPISVSFDVAKMLPEQLREDKTTILDDCGSTVLVRIDR